MRLRTFILCLLITLSTQAFSQADVEVANIRKNYQKISSTKKWTRVDSIELEQSTDGGVLFLFYQGDTLKMMKEYNYGEHGKGLTEYYVLNNQLILVYDKEYSYNRPYYWDSTKMRENKNNQVYDPKKTKVDINRFYFNKGKMIEWIDQKSITHATRDDTFAQNEKSNEEHFKYLLSLDKK